MTISRKRRFSIRNGFGRLFVFGLVGLGLFVPPSGARPIQDDSIPGLRSENAAFLVSLLGTAVPVGVGLLVPDDGIKTTREDLLILGSSIGPSLGYFYGGRFVRGLLSMLLRFGLAGATYGFWSNADANEGFGYVTGGLYVASAIFDLASVKRVVRKRNDAIRARHKIDVAVSPIILPAQKGAGINILLAF